MKPFGKRSRNNSARQESSIWVEVEDRKINAKSLLGVLSMGITKGTRISIIAEGPDEEEAVKALTEMLVKEIF